MSASMISGVGRRRDLTKTPSSPTRREILGLPVASAEDASTSRLSLMSMPALDKPPVSDQSTIMGWDGIDGQAKADRGKGTEYTNLTTLPG